MKMIQVGVGKMGQHWLGLLAESDQIELVGIVEPVPALREAAIDRVNLAPGKAHASLDDAMAATEFDAAVIVTPPATHRPIAEQLLRAGKHVLTEKPLATSLDDAQAMIAVAASAGRTLMVAQNYRHNGQIAAVRALVASGKTGEPRSVSIRFDKDSRTMFGEGDFRYSMPNVLLVDMSIHHFDMLRAITGRNAGRVYAQSWHVPDGNFAGDAAVTVQITLDGNLPVTYRGNWATDAPETTWNGDWEIVCERGRLLWQVDASGESPITWLPYGSEPETIEPVPLPASGQEGLLREFVEAVATGRDPDTSATDNINSIAIVFAAVESAETGTVVTLDTARSNDAAPAANPVAS